MLEFIRDGAHERLMWNIAKWFDSFWLMRWVRRTNEIGSRDGLCFREIGRQAPCEDLSREDEARRVLASIPELLAAIGHGARLPTTRHRRFGRRRSGCVGRDSSSLIPCLEIASCCQIAECRRGALLLIFLT
jgi:hypothetical protein